MAWSSLLPVLAALAVGVLVGLFLYAWRAHLPWERALRERLSGENHEALIPSPSVETARARAAERRSNMQSTFREQELPFPPTPIVDNALRAVLSFEYVERPPGAPDPRRRYFEDREHEKYAQWSACRGS